MLEKLAQYKKHILIYHMKLQDICATFKYYGNFHKIYQNLAVIDWICHLLWEVELYKKNSFRTTAGVHDYVVKEKVILI